MISYGHVINAYEPEKDSMYSDFVEYLNNPSLVKIKDVDNYSMYMVKTLCLLNNTCRYIIAMVSLDYNIVGFTQELSDMKWKSLQMRTLHSGYDIPSHFYEAEAKGPLLAVINRVEKTPEASTYTCEKYPISVALLHTEKKGVNAYQDKGTVIAALETWETIITVK